MDEQSLGLFYPISDQIFQRGTAESLLHAEGNIIKVKMKFFGEPLVTKRLFLMSAMECRSIIRDDVIGMRRRSSAFLMQTKQQFMEVLLLSPTGNGRGFRLKGEASNR